VGVAGFLLLTAGAFWHAFARIEPNQTTPRWNELRWGFLALLLLCLPLETLASSLRIWLLCRVLQPGIAFWTCVKAEWANVAVSLLTPSQSGGGPGQIYMLSRGGARLATALTISVLSFVGTMVGLCLLGVYALTTAGAAAGSLVLAAVGSLTAITLVLVLAARWPALCRMTLGGVARPICRLCGRAETIQAWWPPQDARTGPPVDRLDPLTRRLVDLVYAFATDVRRLADRGRAAFVLACGLSLVFLGSRILLPYLCLRFLGLETATLREVVDAQARLIFVVFFAPTPGGAGLAEGASLALMEGLVPAGFAPHYTLLWRASTAYVAAGAGICCLARALIIDARGLVRRTS
jgi:uncharacterized protein (TIRG00374 family)